MSKFTEALRAGANNPGYVETGEIREEEKPGLFDQLSQAPGTVWQAIKHGIENYDLSGHNNQGPGPVDWGNSRYVPANQGGVYDVNSYWDGEKYVKTGDAWYKPTLPATSIDPSSPGTPTADGQFGALEDPSVRAARMQNDADWVASTMPHLYSFGHGAMTGMGAVVGGMQNAAGLGNSILKNNDIRSVTLVRMEVPCCGGLEAALRNALKACGRDIPLKVVTISVQGEIL